MPNQPHPQKDASQRSLTPGQLALFIPAYHIFNFAFLQGGGLPNSFTTCSK